jgi:molybdopterin converting factor small subunit
MIVTIRLFARAKDLAGIDHVEVQVPVGATVGELRGCLASQVPCLASLVPKCAIALDADFAGPTS